MIRDNQILAMIAVIVLFCIVYLCEFAIFLQLDQMRRSFNMAFDELKAAIERATTVQTAAVALIKDLADRLTAMSNNPNADEMRKLAHELRMKSDELANAIAEHEEDDIEGGEPEDTGPSDPQPEPTRRRR